MASGGLTEMADFTATPASDYCTDTMATMWQHQQDVLFTDCVIKVKDKAIPCHRVVLSAASPYFKAKLSSEFKQEKEIPISMETVDSGIMANVVAYMYGQKATFSYKAIIDVVDVCNLLNLGHLKDQCTKFMSDNLSRENCINGWKLAIKYKMGELIKNSVFMMSKNIATIGGSDEFKELNGDEILSLIKDEDLEMESRDDLLMACVEWVDYQPVVRKDNMMDIMKNIQLEKCSTNTIATIDKKYQDLIHDVGVLSVLFKDSLKRQAHCNCNDKSQHLVLLGGMRNGWNNISNKCFCAKENFGAFDWEEFTEIPTDAHAKKSPIVSLNDGFLVLCGGANKKKTTRYDASNKTWRDLPDSPVALSDASAALCNDDVYLLGGKGPLDTVYRLDLSTLTWHQEANMREKQSSPIVAQLDGMLYVVYNDWNGQKKPCTLQDFDTKTTKSWQYRSSVPQNAPSTHGADLVSTADTLYLVGGYVKIAAQYKVYTDTWSMLTPPSLQHFFGRAALHNGRIYVIGDSSSDKVEVSVYSIQDNTWSTLPANLPLTKYCRFTAALVSWV